MNLVWASLIIAAATGAAVAAILLVRRRAPDGSYFHDGDRAAGVFGVIATGFFLLLGFIIFLAFSSYDQSRNGAETEALVVVQQFETAQFMPPPISGPLAGELVCYGRSVVHDEWPRMEAGGRSNSINPWALALFRTLKSAKPATASEEAAYSKWLDQTSDREEARRDRIHGADGIIPGPLWLVLFFSAALIVVFMLFFADSGERAVVQALQIGSVVAVIAASLLVLRALDTPFHEGFGGLRPAAMERNLRIVGEAMRAVGMRGPLPCDARGAAR